ncbi:MAG: helix-turn-helix transcriptional regulator [Ottowia sp.]|uniref:helix-turn-helix domain-containing protein n=1 Tax=Ottowia sp. TaxID=1898956 RepID=UPI0039E3A2A0
MDESRQRRIAAALGARIAELRTSQGLTQEQVAEQLDMGNQAISRIERGAVLPPITRLYELGEVLGCRVDEFLLDASDRGTDQAAVITQQLAGLAPADRDMVLGIVSQLTHRLTAPAPPKK